MRVLTTFAPLYEQKRKMPNAHLDFHHYYGRQAHFGQTSPSLTTTRERGILPKMVAKNATDFQKSVVLLFGAVFNFSLPFPLLGKRKGQPILAVL